MVQGLLQDYFGFFADWGFRGFLLNRRSREPPMGG